MMMNLRLDGIVPVIPTPFDSAEELDIDSLKAAVEFAGSRRLAGMCLPAYGSEFYKLSDDERKRVVGIAIEHNNGRIPVVAQANHPSAKVAADVARQYEAMGADVISFAIPRLFAVTSDDLQNYCERIIRAVSCPVLLQDFNPGGPTVSVDFLVELKRRCDNLAFVKLEEPMLVEKLAAIHDRLGEELGLLTGWGGCYLMQGLSVGSCGAMPGLAVCDVLDRVVKHRAEGQIDPAFKVFAGVLPYLNYSLENFEAFLQIEKRFLMRRGIFRDARCRMLHRTLSEKSLCYGDQLMDKVLLLMQGEQLERYFGSGGRPVSEN
ncbi:MAG TPA: dihydrodipicolinate synthase family protein [Tepidisphaeraceae bacterium]|nr:dihydrodipicolinate synthase family protein [Tepidisphaeraceae bacterium]